MMIPILTEKRSNQRIFIGPFSAKDAKSKVFKFFGKYPKRVSNQSHRIERGVGPKQKGKFRFKSKVGSIKDRSMPDGYAL